MIRQLGEAGLILALLFSLIQSSLPLWGYFRKNPYFLAVARSCVWLQLFTIAVAYGLLTYAFAINDFSIAYVAANSHPSLPLMYRLTALWGAHEGSILLWIIMLNFWTFVFSLSSDAKNAPTTQALTISVLGIISFCFLTFLLLTSNPFLPAATVSTGNDLNPLLQDPGFVIHPPMLYAGYVGFSVAFAITQAGLLQGQLTAAWAKLTRHFAIAAWCFLTFGITLGSWWAYRVLGWGGFWFWDPVENASLLPWLAGTAFIHVLILVEKRGQAKAWAAFLGLITFALSLLGTFLVRSGVLISAHTFANDPARGVFLLLLLGFVMTAALTLYVIRLPKLTSDSTTIFSFFSREMSLLTQSALLFVAMLTILLGTLYPLILDALHLGTISVGAPYFNLVMMPIVFIIMAAMGLAPFCRWQNTNWRDVWKNTWNKLVLSMVAAALLLWCFTSQIDLIAFISISLSFWIALSITTMWRLTLAMSLAHLGFAVVIIGIMLSSILNQERNVRVKPGDITQVGPYQFLFIDATGTNGSNYRGIRTAFEVTKNNRHITNLYPEKRIYTVRDMIMTKVAIHPGIFRDLYMALGEPLEQDTWSVRIYYKPFMRWIWFGGILMMLGAICSLFTRQRIEKHETN